MSICSRLKNIFISSSDSPLEENPNKAWSIESKSQQFVDVTLPYNEPKKDNHVRVVCISDTHNATEGTLKDIPDGDILIHAGDFTKHGTFDEVRRFNEFLKNLKHEHKIVIAGNHDIGFDEETAKRLHRRHFVPEATIKGELSGCNYLQDSLIEIHGIKIYGSPWTPVFYDWAFLKKRGEDINTMWKKIPANIDILITHGPPLGRGDKTFTRTRAGCVNLLRIVQNHVKPRYHIFGHIHEGYGVSSDGTTTYINASTCNLMYRPVNKPVVFDIEMKDGDHE